MEDLEEFDKQKTKVLKYIIFKKRTEREIRQKFSSVIEKNMLEDIIEELKDNLYIDDNRYIEKAVNEFINLKNMSIKEIKYKLYSKGLNSDIIDTYIEENEDDLEEYELESAKKIVLKKQNIMGKEDIAQYLNKKGYKTETIKEVLTQITN